MNHKSLAALQALCHLSEEEKLWTLETAIRGLSANSRERLSQSLGLSSGNDDSKQITFSYASAKELLLDTTDLITHEKALIAAFAICDLYELKEFTGRQLTEFLKETGNEVSNITAAMSNLIQKGWAEVASKEGESQQSQKRYALTQAGLTKTRVLLQKSTSKLSVH